MALDVNSAKVLIIPFRAVATIVEKTLVQAQASGKLSGCRGQGKLEKSSLVQWCLKWFLLNMAVVVEQMKALS